MWPTAGDGAMDFRKLLLKKDQAQWKSWVGCWPYMVFGSSERISYIEQSTLLWQSYSCPHADLHSVIRCVIVSVHGSDNALLHPPYGPPQTESVSSTCIREAAVNVKSAFITTVSPVHLHFQTSCREWFVNEVLLYIVCGCKDTCTGWLVDTPPAPLAPGSLSAVLTLTQLFPSLAL